MQAGPPPYGSHSRANEQSSPVKSAYPPTPSALREAPIPEPAAPRDLSSIFAPQSIAVIGASDRERSVGQTLMANLLAGGFAGRIIPINPNHSTVMGRPAFANIAAAEQSIDLAVIATPAETVPQVIAQCAEAGVGGAVVISAGFRECGDAGAALEKRIQTQVRLSGMRLIGPNCLGVAVPQIGLNATFARAVAKLGNIAFLSQSGALCAAILDWSIRERVGFSAVVSVGSMLDVGWGDLIDYFGDDPATKAIAIYMESIGGGDPHAQEVRSFLSAAREVALVKPIVVVKSGTNAAAGKAAASHTGRLAGSDAAMQAAFRRAGVLRVETIQDLFDMVHVLDRQPRPRGPSLAIVTNAGGPGVLATDALTKAGGKLAQLSADSLATLDASLPPHWSHGNPIDVLGDASAERYGSAIAAAVADPAVDGILAVLTPQAMSDPAGTAQTLTAASAGATKPILACWMGGEAVQPARDLLRAANIPNFEYPEAAARAFQYLWQYSSNLNALYETPTLPIDTRPDANRQRLSQIITEARAAERTLLTEYESKQVLESYGIPVTPMRLCATADDAVATADQLGYPVVLKLNSRTITHKSDAGGVRLDLCNAAAVRAAFNAIRDSVRAYSGDDAFEGVSVQPMVRAGGYEIILGSTIDPQVGPMVLFGFGGEMVEVFADRALAIPPLTTTLARRLMEQTKIFQAFKGVRGRPPVNLIALEQLIVRFSQAIVEQRWIREIDINPLLVSEKGCIALDARIVLHEQGTSECKIPRTVIRPYPTQYVSTLCLPGGAAVTIRPIRPEDEPQVVRFHACLSDQTVYYRYGGTLKLGRRTSHSRLIRVCFADYDRELPLVVERMNPETREPEILAIGRLNRLRQRDEAEFALVVADPWQKHGVGSRLLQLLIEAARGEGLRRITGRILPDNFAMLHVAEKLGFQAAQAAQGEDWIVSLEL